MRNICFLNTYYLYGYLSVNIEGAARWHLLESLRANPEFFGGAIGFGIGHSLRGLIPKLPAKAAPPKDLGFFVAC